MSHAGRQKGPISRPGTKQREGMTSLSQQVKNEAKSVPNMHTAKVCQIGTNILARQNRDGTNIPPPQDGTNITKSAQHGDTYIPKNKTSKEIKHSAQSKSENKD